MIEQAEKTANKAIGRFIYTALIGSTIAVASALFSYEIYKILNGRAEAYLEASALPIVVLSVLAMTAAIMAVEFSPRVVVSVVSLPMLLAMVFTGPVGAGLVAICGEFWTARKWSASIISTVFNVSVAVLEAVAGATLFLFLKSYFGFSLDTVSFSLAISAAAAAISLLFVNFIFITCQIFVKYPGTLKKLWKRNFLPALPSQFVLIAVGLLILAIYVKAGLVAATLFFVPIFASQHIFKLLVHQKELLAEQTKLSQDLLGMNIGLAGALIMLLDSKDHYTASHSASVAIYCRDMGQLMGMSEDQQRMAHMAGLLHDLGKVGTPDAILKKEGKLTPQEWDQIKLHPETGADALSQLATHKDIADIIRHHQEHFDGSGYPDGLAGDDIPELSRMLAVADTYHALTSDRPYRKAQSPFEALVSLRRVAGTQLDPKYVEVLALVLKNEDLSYREGSKADFLSEFRKDRPAFEMDDLQYQVEGD